MKSHSTELYALMARYLAGESSQEDALLLEKLLVEHPELREEYKFFKQMLAAPSDDTVGNSSAERFDQITKKLKDNGLL